MRTVYIIKTDNSECYSTKPVITALLERGFVFSVERMKKWKDIENWYPNSSKWIWNCVLIGLDDTCRAIIYTSEHSDFNYLKKTMN